MISQKLSYSTTTAKKTVSHEPTFGPRLYEYVFIENDIVFNENATIVLHLHIVFISFSVYENDEKDEND